MMQCPFMSCEEIFYWLLLLGFLLRWLFGRQLLEVRQTPMKLDNMRVERIAAAETRKATMKIWEKYLLLFSMRLHSKNSLVHLQVLLYACA